MTERRRFRIGQLLLASFFLALALAAFLWVRPPGPRAPSTPLRIGTATEGGIYEKIGKALEPVLAEGLPHHEVVAVPTKGSIDNVNRLKRRTLDLALIQSDVEPSDEVKLVAPLYREYLHIIVRSDRIPNAASIKDLNGKRVAIGPEDSGSRVTVEKVLGHFGVRIERKDFGSVAEERDALINGEIDAICRVAGLPDEIVKKLLEKDGMLLVPVSEEEELKGFRENYSGYEVDHIAQGTYTNSRYQSSPKTATIFVTALLVARVDLDRELVHQITKLLDESLVAMKEDRDVRKYVPDSDDLERNADHNRQAHAYHAGALRYHKGKFDWYPTIPLVAAGLLLLFGLVIALREARRVWRSSRISRYSDPGDSSRGMSHDVFLCHSSTGRHGVVEQISETLEERGFRCWYAPRNIPSGREWPELIPTAIRQTELALVLVFTEHANQSEHIARELTLASSMKLKLIPYLLEDAQPKGSIEYHIANVQWIEAYAQPKERSLAQLLEALNRVRREKSAPATASTTGPTLDSPKALAPDTVSEVTPTPAPGSSTPRFPLRRSLPWLVGAGVLALFGVALALWPFAEEGTLAEEVTPAEEATPILSKPAPDGYVLGGLTYEWAFERGDEKDVEYEVRRSSGKDVRTAEHRKGYRLRENALSGEITWEVRALVPNSDGDLMPTPWSDSRHVEYYEDTLDKIRHRKEVVVAVEEELKEKKATDPEIVLIRMALEGHLGESIRITQKPYPFNQLKTVFTGEDKDTFDLIAAYLSVRKKRKRLWNVEFTDPFMTYPQVFVLLPKTDVCVGSGSARPCRIAVVAGTVSEHLARQLTKGNPKGEVVPVGDVTLAYQEMYDMLRRGRVDLLLMDQPFAVQLKAEASKKTPIVLYTVGQVLDDPPEWEKIAIATKRGDARLRKVLNDAIKQYDEEIKRAVEALQPEPMLER